MVKRYDRLHPFYPWSDLTNKNTPTPDLFFYEEVRCESDEYKSEDFLKMCGRNVFNQSGSNLCANDPPHTKEDADFIVDICELIVRNQGRYWAKRPFMDGH